MQHRPRQWIADRLKELGLRKKDLASAWKVDGARVTEVLKGTREVQQWEIDPAAELLQMPRGEVMERLGYNTKPGQYIDIADFRLVEVQGTVQAGAWQDATHRPDLPPVLVPRIIGAKTLFALQVRGESMNKIVREGDILVCQPLYEYVGEFENEMLVIVERRFHDQIEATVKELEIRDGEFWLWPRSDNPEFQAPIKVPPPELWGDDESAEIRVTAVVLRSMHDRLPRR